MVLVDTFPGHGFGGCVDSTGAVMATASIYDDDNAKFASAVVKMLQNVLIAPFSVGVAYWWMKRNNEKTQSTISLLWKNLPKFVLGFIVVAIFFNTAVPEELRNSTQEFAFIISEWFSTCSFVSIGFSLRFFQQTADANKKANQTFKFFLLYCVTQIIDIVLTAGFAFAAFKDLKGN